jgi:hypothetical protein
LIRAEPHDASARMGDGVFSFAIIFGEQAARRRQRMR